MATTASLTTALAEESFPGNTAAFNQLKEAIDQNNLIAFTGAGTSAPVYPTWPPLLSRLIDSARENGQLSEDAADFLRQQSTNSPLDAAEELETALTAETFRARLATIFQSKANSATDQHRLLIQIPFQAYITLNFDNGLETAFTSEHSSPARSFSLHHTHQATLWSKNDPDFMISKPIIHLHGTSNEPERMIITASDYQNFYITQRRAQFIEDIWTKERLLLCGFGFSDPFLKFFAEKISHTIAGDSQHYAIIARNAPTRVADIERRQFIKKYRLTPIFYHAPEIDRNGNQDHSGLGTILRALAKVTSPGNSATKSDPTAPVATTTRATKKRQFEQQLMVAPGGSILYVEPQIWNQPKSWNHDDNASATRLPLEEITESKKSYCIIYDPESGATTLARRLFEEVSEIDSNTVFKSANDLPVARYKLEKELAHLATQPPTTIILDDFNQERHDRLIRELIGLGYFARFILFSRTIPASATGQTAALEGCGIPFQEAFLWNVDRAGIRELARSIFSTADENLISTAVDKAYSDLLALRIPLTPTNTIMYLRILHKEGDFHPVNRVQIVERYMTEVLRSPSDAYVSAFNSRNKLDLLSAFCHHLFTSKGSHFSLDDWLSFTSTYKAETLLEFDQSSLLFELAERRVIAEIDGTYFFRYSMFFNFLCGRHIAARHDIFAKYISAEQYLLARGTSEVVACLSPDNTALLDSLVDKLSWELEAFWNKYMPESANPFDDIKWIRNQKRDDTFWDGVTKKIESGPYKPQEIDTLKTSLLGEAAARNQNIIYREFQKFEHRLFVLKSEIVEILKNADSAGGQAKVRAVEATLRSDLVILQVTLMLAPVIARRRLTPWHGLLFINSITSSPDETDEDRVSEITRQAISMISTSTIDRLGAKKLGEVFKSLALKENNSNLTRFLVFSLILHVKPKNWISILSDLIRREPIESWYLLEMLLALMANYKMEVNTGIERANIRELVALIQAKRQYRKLDPGNRAVSHVLRDLEHQKFFDEDKPKKHKTKARIPYYHRLPIRKRR